MDQLTFNTIESIHENSTTQLKLREKSLDAINIHTIASTICLNAYNSREDKTLTDNATAGVTFIAQYKPEKNHFFDCFSNENTAALNIFSYFFANAAAEKVRYYAPVNKSILNDRLSLIKRFRFEQYYYRTITGHPHIHNYTFISYRFFSTVLSFPKYNNHQTSFIRKKIICNNPNRALMHIFFCIVNTIQKTSRGLS